MYVDYSNEKYFLGDSCVYVWVTKQCQIVYVGCGDSWRAVNPAGRNEDFNAQFALFKMKPFVLCANVNRKEAQMMETLIIWKAMCAGWSLTNKSKILSPSELALLRAEKEDSEIYSRYQQLMDDYPLVAEAFDKLHTYCLDTVLSEEGELAYDPIFERGRSRKVKYLKHVWTIGGETKSGKDWGKIYGRSLGRVVELMTCYGCTPKEGLTFPSLPRDLYKKVSLVEWWNSKGYHPGTDDSSYVTPRNEWPKEWFSE